MLMVSTIRILSVWGVFNKRRSSWIFRLYAVRLNPSRHAHFLEQDFTAFDAPFFSVTPNEAKAMDPTHRILLEATYEGFENGKTRADLLHREQDADYV